MAQNLDKDKVNIRPQTPKEKEHNEENIETPQFRIKLDYSEDEIKKLSEDFFLEFEALVEERKQEKLSERWLECQAIYDGNVRKAPRLKFNLSTKQGKIKSDAVVRALRQSFLDQDPMFTITPRPDFAGKGGFDVADKQSDFLDYEMEENIQPEAELTKIWRTSVNKYVGIQKLHWEYKMEKRKREETYEGKKVVVGVGDGGSLIKENEGVKQFLKNYPTAMKDYKGLIKKLLDGKTIDVVVDFQETIRNSAKLRHVKIEDFYVKNSVRGNGGLKDNHLTVERERYTYWELQDKEANEEFQNVADLYTSDQVDTSESGETTTPDDPKTSEFNVLKGTYYWSKDGGEEMKIQCWFGEESKSFLGAIIFPWYGIDSEYKGYWLFDNDKGFYGAAESLLWHLKDSNIAEDVLLNLGLHGAYARNILTPITREGSEIEKRILENKWTEGLPLSVPDEEQDVSKALSFVQYPNMDVTGIISLVQYLKKQDDDVSLISSGMSGRENPIDPSAPGNKTIALLKVSGINIQDHIRHMLPSFNETASDILQMYYQMSDQGRKFQKRYKVKTRSNATTGSNVFETIGRQEMVAKTNIQSRASAFAFDKIEEKKENLAMYQILLANPIAARRPKFIYKALISLMKSWSPFWKHIAENELPNVEEFALEQREVAIQALAQLAQVIEKQTEVTGIPPQINIDTLVQAISEAQQTAAFGAPVGEEKKK